MNTNDSFFDESAQQSRVKTEIITKYFSSWASVITGSLKQSNDRIAYFDLYAGPGFYRDGTKSTPIKIIEHAISTPALQQRLVAVFNEKDASRCAQLREAVMSLPGIENLHYPPSFHQEEVGNQVIELFKRMRMVPSFVFLDPWGYKGLCLDLVQSAIKDWACECAFFFNYRRVNMALENETFRDHMDSLFTKQIADELRAYIVGKAPWERENEIMKQLCLALKAKGNRFVLQFRFRAPEKDRTSHYLVFVTKNVRGYDIMKNIMAKESSSTEQGVPTFEFNPAFPCDNLLFGPMDELKDSLCNTFAGRTLTMKDVFMEHNVGTRYIETNYKKALTELEESRRLSATPSMSERRKGTFAGHVSVAFPKVG